MSKKNTEKKFRIIDYIFVKVVDLTTLFHRIDKN